MYTHKHTRTIAYNYLILYVGIVYLWSKALCDLSWIEPLILVDSATILWSSPLEQVSIPFYCDRNGLVGPFQPVLPASFTSEQEFLASINSFNNNDQIN